MECLTVKTKAGMTPLDLANSEETHLFVEESGKTSKKGTLNGKEKAEVSEPKTSLEDKSEYSGGEATAGEHEEQVNESVKMKDKSEYSWHSCIFPSYFVFDKSNRSCLLLTS
ncbi:hypothetical protein OIU84_022458 [Salix udensis]|uniref:Uncharacterized protein n=1 Tax=Salix udensis TaxID=889485 RepID=A0AAD6KQ21_9ROSI|nr:hypothetical protein OIU84_022458 [Salix udensis]